MSYYKQFLESGKIEDVPDSTLRRRKRRWNENNINIDVNDTLNGNEYLTSNMNRNQKKAENISKHLSASLDLNDRTVEKIHSLESLIMLPNANQLTTEEIENERTIQRLQPLEDTELQTTITEIAEKNTIIMNADQATIRNVVFEQDLFHIIENVSNDLRFPKDLVQFLSNADLLRTISKPVDKCPGEIMLMILRHILSCKLSLIQITHLFELVNNIFIEPVFPNSKYYIDKIFNSSGTNEYHGICPNCGIYIGKLENLDSFIICTICQKKVDFSNPSCPNVFLIMDPSEHIRMLMKVHGDYYTYIVKERKYDGTISKIYDGKCYRKFIESLKDDERYRYITSILNSDGAPRFENSQYSIWPVYLKLNEIPLNLNGNNVIPIAMWFGKSKPNMAAFLDPITSFLNKLTQDGIRCEIQNIEVYLKLYIVLVCVDAVARAPMQGFMQFNSHYGCNQCYHPGEYFARSIRYPVLKSPMELRATADTLAHMDTLVKQLKDNVFGIKNVTPLINLSSLHIIKGFDPDYMHCCLAGVGKQIVELLISDLSTHKIKALDYILEQMEVPHQVSRLTRPLSDRGQWKAKEWENFILHYSSPLFELVLNQKYCQYWYLFVDSLFILLKDKITYSELDLADAKLHEFVYTTQTFFTKQAMTFNVHQLLHLATSVANWGPLFDHSTFPFEAANHNLLQAIHCAKGVNLQIVRFINIQRIANEIERIVYPTASLSVQDFCSKVTRTKKSFKISDITYLGQSTILPCDLVRRLNLPLNSTFVYNRMVKDGCLYTCENKTNARSNNSYAQLYDGRFIKVIHFLVNPNVKAELTFFKTVKTARKLCESILLVDEDNDNEVISIIKTAEIKSVCVYMKIQNVSYISKLPNLYHY